MSFTYQSTAKADGFLLSCTVYRNFIEKIWLRNQTVKKLVLKFLFYKGE